MSSSIVLDVHKNFFAGGHNSVYAAFLKKLLDQVGFDQVVLNKCCLMGSLI